jgi:hypothetical protein
MGWVLDNLGPFGRGSRRFKYLGGPVWAFEFEFEISHAHGCKKINMIPRTQSGS